MKKFNSTHKLCFLLLCLIYSGQTFSARYDMTQINEPVVNAINNVGTIVGTNIDGLPYVRRRNQSDMSYPDEADIAQEDRVFNILLPTDFTYSEIHVLDINNELEQGSGGSIVGWYVDENDRRQSVLWYQEENQRQEFEYISLTLPPHTLSPNYCTGRAEADFPNTECMFSQDSDLIYRATLCATGLNENWQTPNNIFVDLDFDYSAGGNPDCSSENTLPICEFKAEKLPDGKKTVQGEDGPKEVDAFKYVLNPKYETQQCILKEHADFVVQAIQCDNSNFKAAGDAIVIKCDTSSQAIGINNESLIAGTSFKPENTNRPVIWIKGEGQTSEGKQLYNSADLGTLRSIVDSNDDTISKQIDITYRNGYPTAVDKTTNAVVGMLRLNGPDSVLTPTYWAGVSVTDYDSIEHLSAPDATAPTEKTKINSVCNGDSPANIPFTTAATPTSTAAGILVGWYEDTNTNPKAIMWVPCPTKENEVVTEKLKSGHLPSFDDRNIGKALDNSPAGETIGTTLTDVTDDNGDLVSENHAFYRTTRCGIQDINELLATPINDGSLLLESAYFIATGVPPTPILALGKETETGNVNSYVLAPTKIFTDLAVRINSDHETLTVGDQHTINIIIENKGAIDNESTSNYATCIFFKLSATVYTQDTYEDKIKQLGDGVTITDDIEKQFENYPKISDELVGGLTFDEFDESNQDIACVVSRIDIICALERLDPGSAVSISVKTTPRPLLADRTIRTTASVFSTESETSESLYNNTAFELIDVEREACFIATAAYGSYLAPEVKVLREFRDNILLKSTLGKQAVNFYYDVSPPLANYIAKNEVLRNITRWLLSPIIYAVAYPMISLIAFLLLLGFGVKYASRKRETQIIKVA